MPQPPTEEDHQTIALSILYPMTIKALEEDAKKMEADDNVKMVRVWTNTQVPGVVQQLIEHIATLERDNAQEMRRRGIRVEKVTPLRYKAMVRGTGVHKEYTAAACKEQCEGIMREAWKVVYPYKYDETPAE